MANEIEKVVTPPLMGLLGKYKGQIEQILPKHMTSTRVLKLIVGAINRTPQLMSCTPMSVINAVLTAATMGLEIRPGSAYLIPYGRECTLIIDYRGKIDLALRTGKVTDIDAEVVYSKEKFRIYRDENGHKVLEHEPLLYSTDGEGSHIPLVEKDRGVPIGAYAVASIKEGPPKIVFMPFLDIDKIRLKSRAKDNGPWKTDTMEMWKKTVIHRICKTLPQSPELALAQDITEREETGISLDSIIDIAPEDQDHMPMLPDGSKLLAEQVAEEKIQQLESQQPDTPKSAPAPQQAPPVATYETWDDWSNSGAKEHPKVIIRSGHNAGTFRLDEETREWHAEEPAPAAPTAAAAQPTNRPKPVFGKRGQ